MIDLFKKKKILSKEPVSVYNDEPAQVLVMKRNGYLFVFNFSPTNSYNNYQIDADPGKYKIVLDTDWKEFNGFERNSRKVSHFTRMTENGEKLSLYLPSRSAFVLKRLK